MRRAIATLALVLVVALAVAGCGDDGESAGTQPTPEGTGFDVTGAFDTLPRYPRSDEAGRRTEAQGAIVQSFVTTGATPDRVVRWYEATLQARGWGSTGAAPAGASSWRADFEKSGERLRVSAARAPTVGNEPGGDQSVEQARTQYSLTLRAG